MPNQNVEIIVFFCVTTILILLLSGFICAVLYVYQKKHLSHNMALELLKESHEKNILFSELKIREETFQNISREIHDNIGLSLTLAKLQLNTLIPSLADQSKIEFAISLLSQSIVDLSNLSKSMDSELIEKNGFLKALEYEMNVVRSIGIYKIDFQIAGNPFFLEKSREILMYRIVQEGLNNVLKHSKSTEISINIFYTEKSLRVKISDSGVGFEMNNCNFQSSGLKNIKHRTLLLNGVCNIFSKPNFGTTIEVIIPN